MRASQVILLCACLGACAPPPRSPGLSGATTVRDDDQPAARDATSITLAKGELHLVHDVDAIAPCGGDCALKSKGRSLVTLTLGPNGVAAVTDEGAMIERFRSAAGATKHLTEWHNSFTGSWTQGNDELKLRLEPKDTTCTRRSASGEADEACEAQTKLELTCRTAKLKVKAGTKKARAWVCANDRALTSGATPVPWAFGIDQPLRSRDVIRGHQQRRTYARHESQPAAAD